MKLRDEIKGYNWKALEKPILKQFFQTCLKSPSVYSIPRYKLKYPIPHLSQSFTAVDTRAGWNRGEYGTFFRVFEGSKSSKEKFWKQLLSPI